MDPHIKNHLNSNLLDYAHCLTTNMKCYNKFGGGLMKGCLGIWSGCKICLNRKQIK